jgi:hypothetical protein
VRTAKPDIYERFDYRVAPLNDPNGSTPGGPEPQGGEAGQGSTIRLVEASGERGRFYPGRKDRQNMFLLTQRDTHLDYEAIGASVSAEAGDTTRIRVGVRNKGPGDFGITTRPWARRR